MGATPEELGTPDWMKALDWECHICGRTRPDNKISVAVHWHTYPSGMRTGSNVRYCNDNATCKSKALLNDFTDLRLHIVTQSLKEAWAETHRIERHLPWIFLVGLALGLLIPMAFFGWAPFG